jgi:thymidine kinase
MVKSHDGRQMRAYALDADLHDLSRLVRAHTRCVFADEVQFWDRRFVEVVRNLNARGIDVVCAGLPLDCAERPFGCMPDLLAIADTIITLKARCNACGEPATRTQRLVNGQAAKASDALVVIGGADQYEARCRACYVLG